MAFANKAAESTRPTRPAHRNKASHNERLAEKLAKMGMPCFGCTPDWLPELLATVLKSNDVRKFAEGARLT